MNLFSLLLPYQRSFLAAPQKRKIWLSSRQAGKSFAMAWLASYKALVKRSGLSLVISTGSRAANEMMRKCIQMAEAVKTLTDGELTYESSADSVRFSNGSRILSLPSGNPAALRGFTAQSVIVDEANYIENPEEVLAAIAPTLTRDPDAELILASTPAGKNSYLYKLWTKALDDPAWFTQRTSIHDAIHGGLKVDLEALKQLCPDPDIWRMEYEAEFVDAHSSFIDPNLLDWYEEDEAPSSFDAKYLGMDVGSHQDRSACTTMMVKGDTAYVQDIAMLNRVEYTRQLEIVQELNAKHRYSAGLVDETGIGSALAELLSKKVSSRISGLSFTASNKTNLYEAVRSLIFSHKIFFNSKLKPLITADFQNVSRIVTESGSVKYTAGHNDDGHSDATSSLVLAVEAWHQHPASIQAPISFARQTAFGSVARIF